MIYHIVTGDVAATPLREAITMEPSLEGEVLVVKDVLSVGPLIKEGEQSFSEMRSAFWQDVSNNDKNPVQVDDFDRLVQVINRLSENEDAKIWMWIAPIPADIATYYWSLKYLNKFAGRFYIINIAGLPFLDESGKIFFPKSIGEIQPKELVKARKLARPITPAEFEVDGEEWRKLTAENGGVRILEGGKRLISKGAEYYDNQLLGFATQQYQKASKIIGLALTKFNIPTGDTYLGWRLRQIAAAERLNLQGDVTKGLKDFDVKLPSGLLEFTPNP